jgi:predicted nucleic acid-binding protein
LNDQEAEAERRPRGLLDTSAVIDIERLSVEELPIEIAISAITVAELSAGPHATEDPHERARRMEGLQTAEATFDQLAFDAAAARAYGRIYAALLALGRKARGRRALDTLIAATALANELPLYTCNPEDFEGLEELIHVVAVVPGDAGDSEDAQSAADAAHEVE